MLFFCWLHREPATSLHHPSEASRVLPSIFFLPGHIVCHIVLQHSGYLFPAVAPLLRWLNIPHCGLCNCLSPLFKSSHLLPDWLWGSLLCVILHCTGLSSQLFVVWVSFGQFYPVEIIIFPCYSFSHFSAPAISRFECPFFLLYKLRTSSSTFLKTKKWAVALEKYYRWFAACLSVSCIICSQKVWDACNTKSTSALWFHCLKRHCKEEPLKKSRPKLKFLPAAFFPCCGSLFNLLPVILE